MAEAAEKKVSDDEKALEDYFAGLAGEAPFQIRISRQAPKVYNGISIEGVLDTVNEMVTEDDIKERFGGGRYQLRLLVQNEKGSYQYRKARLITIAGPPKVDELLPPSDKDEDTGQSMLQEVVRMAERRADRAEERARLQEERRGSGNSEMMQHFTSQLETMQQALAEKDAQIMDLLTRRPETSSAELLLGKALDGESVRIQHLEARHASELRERDMRHGGEIDRLHERYRDDVARREDAHAREMSAIQQAYQSQIEALKLSYEGRMDGLKREIARADRDLEAMRAENAELRSKKERSIVEVMTEMATVKTALEEFSGGSTKDETPAWERVIQGVMGSPLATGIAARIAAATEPPAPPEPTLPVNQPTKLPSGQTVVRLPDNRIVEVRPRNRPRPQPPAGEQAPALDPALLKGAVRFMESSLNADRDPQVFVSTARSLASDTIGPVTELLRAQGADGFLRAVSEVEPDSVLLQQHGKNWVRKVVAILLD